MVFPAIVTHFSNTTSIQLTYKTSPDSFHKTEHTQTGTLASFNSDVVHLQFNLQTPSSSFRMT